MINFRIRLWVVVWMIALLMVFEPQLRILGDNISQPSTILFPGIWLSDVGLLLPIALVILSPRHIWSLLSNRLLILYSGIVAYGVILGLIRENWFPSIAFDLRTSIALVTGLSLVTLASKKPATLASVMIVVSFAAVGVAVWSLISSTRFELLANGIGISEPVYFTVSGLTICLLSPSVILATAVRQRFLILTAWSCIGLLLTTDIAFAQTRTHAFTSILAIVLASIGVFTSTVFNEQKRAGRRSIRLLNWAMLIVLAVGIIFSLQSEYGKQFMARVQMIGTGEDINWIARVDEAKVAFDMMNGLDHLVGMGFGVRSSSLALTGKEAIVLHIALLNIWWRLGILVFAGAIVLIFVLIGRYLRSILLTLQPVAFRARNSGVRAIVICAPGALTLLFTALFSGGWTVSTMISLGILWGVYKALVAVDYHN